MLVKILSLLMVAALAAEAAEDSWWRNMQLYQIYPRSFQDSNGDGIGDIKGIIERLDHLSDIGIGAVWLSPIFPSPMKDFGYDISDYYGVAKEYGTMENLKDLIAEANKRGIKVLLDFVPNHTSDECDWFKKSANRTEGFEDFYVWHNGTGTADKPIPPSNWISVFRGSAWTWNDQRKQFYLHQFLSSQPDLNYRSPRVVEEMQNVLKFWLEKGISGFRVDAIPHLVEADVDAKGVYPDEKPSNLTNDKESYSYLIHTETRERDLTYEIVYNWREVLDNFTISNKTDTNVLLMEAMSDVDLVMRYYGNGTIPGAHFPFNFNLVFLNQEANAKTFEKSITSWFDKLPEGRVTNWVIGNHDQPRVATRFGPERSDGVVMMSMLLPGVSVTYQGEEIAMENQYISFDDGVDPQGCQDKENFNTTSRDPERTPFQWDNTTSAGFSKSNKTWLPVADNYETLNLKAQNKNEKSPYKLYKELSALRKRDAIKNGSLTVKALDANVLAFLRNTTDDTILVIINTSENNTVANLTVFDQLEKNVEVVATSVASKLIVGQKFASESLKLSPYEALVFKNGASGLYLSHLLALLVGLVTSAAFLM